MHRVQRWHVSRTRIISRSIADELEDVEGFNLANRRVNLECSLPLSGAQGSDVMLQHRVFSKDTSSLNRNLRI
jgi:hypothetical protein